VENEILRLEHCAIIIFQWLDDSNLLKSVRVEIAESTVRIIEQSND